MSPLRKIERVVKRNGEVFTVGVGDSVAEAASRMRRHRVGCLIVVNDRNRVAGIISERDIVRKIVAERTDPQSIRVAAVMTPNVLCCTMQTDVEQIRKVMASRGIRHVPILQDGAPVGMVSSRDMLAYRLSEAEEVVRRQAEMLQHLEGEHPGIGQLERDSRGRIVI